MKTFALLTMLVAFSLPAVSQKEPIKYGKLSNEDIDLTEYQGYDAVVLCDYGTYSFDARLGQLYFYFSRHLRIRILTEEGIKYAKQTIPFYDLKKATYFRNNRVYELKAETINPEKNKKPVKSKVKSKHYKEFVTDADFNNSLEIDFPDVQPGSIIEYEIKIPTIEVVNPPIWLFQHDIPVLYSELRIISPEYIQYSGKTYNVDYLDLSETNYQTRVLSFPRGSYSYQAYTMQFVKTNVPATGPNVPDYDRMYLKIMLEFASQKFTIPGVQYLFRAVDREYKYKDRAEKNTTLTNNSYILYKRPDSLEDLAKKMLKDPYFGPPLNIHMGLNDTIRELTKESSGPNEKIQVIYNFVSNHMNWNGLYRSFVDPSLSKVILKFIGKISHDKANLNKSLSKPFDEQVGTNAEINFILINSLRKAGIKAYPVLVSLKDNECLDPMFFNLHQFNHVVALVESDGKNILLDAVLTDNGPLFKSKEISNVGLVIKHNEAYWITIE